MGIFLLVSLPISVDLKKKCNESCYSCGLESFAIKDSQTFLSAHFEFRTSTRNSSSPFVQSCCSRESLFFSTVSKARSCDKTHTQMRQRRSRMCGCSRISRSNCQSGFCTKQDAASPRGAHPPRPPRTLAATLKNVSDAIFIQFSLTLYFKTACGCSVLPVAKLRSVKERVVMCMRVKEGPCKTRM